jgi:HK97 gp10 family phage protein
MANNLGPKVSMTMHGFDGLRIALMELPEKVAARVLSNAVAKGARLTLKAARTEVKVDTGLLRRMLRATRGKRDELAASAYVTVRRLSKKKIAEYKKRTGKAAATNPEDPFYWSILEFGKTTRTAHPFIRPAFEATKVQAAEEIKRDMALGVEKEATKLRWASGTK